MFPRTTAMPAANRSKPLGRWPRHRLWLALATALFGAPTLPVAAQQFAPVIALGTLDGTDGFRLDGVDVNQRSGGSVGSAGDVNGDGVDDLVISGIGAPPPLGGTSAGHVYVVFGRTNGFPATASLSELDGSNGFRLDGATAGDRAGVSVTSAGDINGDGLADLIVGAYRADPAGKTDSGAAYIVFGRQSGFPASLSLASLDGSDGFRLDGVAAADYTGLSVSAAGDVNDDGMDDVIIGSPNASPSSGISAGSSYVVFGRSSAFPPTLDLADLDGTIGFRIDGVAANDRSGIAVGASTDVNGDGIADLIIGADRADSGTNGDEGRSYVVFGRNTAFPAVLNLASLSGSNGLRLDGVAERDYSGRAVSAAGDINGDGLGDLIVGAYRADPDGNEDAGSCYVVFGRSSVFPPALGLGNLTGAEGFRLDGVAAFDYACRAVDAGADINGDGISDLIIGAFGAGSAGATYVLFGRDTGFPSSLSLNTLDGANGFRLDGSVSNDESGFAIGAAGDINADGIDDLIVGAPRASPSGIGSAGSSYVVFGRNADILFNSGFEPP